MPETGILNDSLAKSASISSHLAPLAQSVRAVFLYSTGRWFKSSMAYQVLLAQRQRHGS